MVAIGVVLLIIGGLMTLLEFTGFASAIPLLDRVTVPQGVWIGVAIIGLVLAMMFRRTRD